MASEAEVRQICLGLLEVIETPYEGLPGFRVKKKLFARIRERPNALLVWRPDVLDKENLITAEPTKFFQTPHYEGHPGVLVHLEAIDFKELEELLVLSWTINAPASLVAAYESRMACSQGEASLLQSHMDEDESSA